MAQCPPRTTATGRRTVTDNWKTSQDVKKLLGSSVPFPWEDTDFPPCIKLGKLQGVEWKRPGDLVPNPMFIADNTESSGVLQGHLNDCWLVSTITSLTLYPEYSALFRHIVPPDQDFGPNYRGVFHFRFWQYGEWKDVMVDDRLPVKCADCGDKEVPFYVRSAHTGEFWGCLLEKAYAKLNGSYEFLSTNQMTTALVDLTGGITFPLFVDEYRKNKEKHDQIDDLFEKLCGLHELKSFMGCMIDKSISSADHGLVEEHCYSVTSVVQFSLDQRKESVRLVRLRNPTGSVSNWNGAWSPGSEEWKNVPTELMAKEKLDNLKEGDFWMPLDEFIDRFLVLEAGCLDPMFWQGKGSIWQKIFIEGRWEAGATTCDPGIKKRFLCNPQFRIKVSKQNISNDGNNVVVIGLLQNKWMDKENKKPSIGIAVYKLNDPYLAHPITEELFDKDNPKEIVNDNSDVYQFSVVEELAPGTYVIIPYSVPEQQGDFLLRILSLESVTIQWCEQYNTNIIPGPIEKGKELHEA